jgi:hypothetical protein
MKCHNCQAKTEVEETRVIEENPRWIKRRRVCKNCGFTAVDCRDARRRCCCEGDGGMTERQIVNWLLGFVIGILTVLAWQRVMSEPLIVSDAEATRAEELISIYKRGVRDALKTNPVSFELEQVCLEVWANKQPVEVK